MLVDTRRSQILRHETLEPKKNLDTDSPINEIDEQLFEDVTTTKIVDNIIYYLAGFVAKKIVQYFKM